MNERNYFIRIRGMVYAMNLTLEEAKEWYRHLQKFEPKVTRLSKVINKYN